MAISSRAKVVTADNILIVLFLALPIAWVARRRLAGWRCKSRREEKRMQDDEAGSVESVRPSNDIQKIRSEMAEMKSILFDLRDRIKDIVRTQQFLSPQYDEIKTGQEKIEPHLKNMEGKMRQMVDQNRERNTNIDELSKRVLELDHRSRERKLEIHGVEETVGEDTVTVVTKIANRLDIVLNPHDLGKVHRVNGRNRENPRPILIEFNNSIMYTDVMEKKKITILNKKIFNGNSDRRIYIYEYLSVLKKNFFGNPDRSQREGVEICLDSEQPNTSEEN